MTDPQESMASENRDPKVPFQPGMSRRVVQRGTYHVPTSSKWAPEHANPPAGEEAPATEPALQQAPTDWSYSEYVLEDPPIPPEPRPRGQYSGPQQQATSPGPSAPFSSDGGFRAHAAATAPVAPPAREPKEKTRRGPGWLALFLSTILAVVLGAGIALTAVHTEDSSAELPSAGGSMSKTEESGAQEVVPEVTEGAAAPNWQAVATAVRPATVSIMVEGANASATGSGVVYDSEARVITNHHVVEPALTSGTITVTTHDGRVYEAVIVGTDQTTDLAVLQIQGDPTDLLAARFGTSEQLEVGQPVMAVGSPLGLADTVTTGIISALDRPVTVEASGGVDPANPQAGAQTELVVTNAIQIDASINPGNSGGPLFDASGAVIGINSSIASNSSSADTAGSIGLGFAIPVDLVKSVADQIISTGSVQHALLGVEIKSGVVVRGASSQLGAEIATVMDGGAAAQAGLQPGDLIVGIDGHSVTSGPALTGFVRRYTAGNEVTLDVVRDGADMQVTAELQAR